MKKAILLMLLAAAPAWAQETSTRGTTTGDLEIGVWTSSLSGSPDLVSEYDPADRTRPLGRLGLRSRPDWGNVRFESRALDAENQQHELVFDIKRVVRSHTTYTRFLPRLGHDPMTNLVAATRNGRIVYNTDTDPAAEYLLKHGLLEHRTEIRPSGLPGLVVGLNYRDQRRSGAHQTLTISHCDACHVYSQSHRIDEKLREGMLDAKVSWASGALKGSLTRRELRQGVPSVSLLYDRGLQPELRTPIFDNRLTFDALEGPQGVDNLQDVDKNVGKLDLSLQNVLGFRVSAGGVWSTTENRFTGLEADYKGYTFSTTRSFRSKLNLRLRGRTYSLGSDDVAVDTRERIGSAGPQAGKTYRQIYGFNPDFLRQSTTGRDVYEADAELSYKLGRKAGTLRGFWSYQNLDRDHYEVAPGIRRTVTNVAGVAWRASPAKGVKMSAVYRHGFVDQPLMLVNGACSTIPAIAVTSPLAPGSIQYFQVHDARVAETTAAPESWDELKLQASLTRARVMLSGSYRLRDASNQAGDLTDWSRTSHALTTTLWAAPSPRFDAYLAYSWQKLDLDSHVCVPVFDG